MQAKDSAANLSTPIAYHFYVNAPNQAVAYWKLDEGSGGTATGTVETDPTAAGPSATLSPTVTWTTGRVDGGLHFDGTSAVANTTARVNTDADLTVSAWVRLPSKGSPLTAVSEDSTGISGFLLQYRPELDRFAFTMPQTDATSTYIDIAWSTSPVPLNTWVHLAGVYWKSQQKIGIYVNGVLEGTASHTLPWNAVGTVQIGRAWAGGHVADWWPGDVDEVRVYDRSLSTEEVVDIVNYTKPGPVGVWHMDDPPSSTVAWDTSGYGRNATRSGNATFVAGGHDGGALNLTGTNGTAHTAGPVLDTTNTVSVSAWVKLASKSATVIALSQDGTTNARFGVEYRSDIDRWTIDMVTNDTMTPGIERAASTSVPALNQWTFLAATWDATARQARLYVNGNLESTVSAPETWSAGGYFSVGTGKWKGAHGGWWVGQIDEARAYDRVLYAGEAADLYSDGRTFANLGAPDGHWRLDEPAGSTTAADSSGRNRPATLSATGAAFDPAGHTGGALSLDGVTGYAATAAAATRTDRGFAVSAWVKLADATAEQSVLSQSGTNASGFSLNYLPDFGGTWSFSLPSSDKAGAGPTVAAEKFAADTVGAWVHVVGAYDGFTHTASVYVSDSFGTRVGFGRQGTPWHASGPLQLGRDLTVDPVTGAPMDGEYLAGSVDEVRLFTGSLSPGDLAVLVKQ